MFRWKQKFKRWNYRTGKWDVISSNTIKSFVRGKYKYVNSKHPCWIENLVFKYYILKHDPIDNHQILVAFVKIVLSWSLIRN